MALVAITFAGPPFGDMTSFGNLASAFDGTTNAAGAASAVKSFNNTGNGYVGSIIATPKVLGQAILFGTNNNGFVATTNLSTTLEIYGKLGSNPASSTDGTLLASLTITDTANESAGRTLNISNTGTYDRVWARLTHADTTSRAVAVAELQAFEVVATGSLAATETGADTAAIAGAVAIGGTLAATETGSDTAAGAGAVAITGSLSTIEAADTAAIVGIVESVGGGGFFEPVIAAIAGGHTVHAALFVENHFNATTSRNWTGLGTIVVDGRTWIGTGELVKLGALAFGGDDAAPGLTMTLSGVDPAFVSEARTMPSVHGLQQLIYLQFFDADTLAPVGDFYELDRRYMDVIGYSITGSSEASVSLSSESEWTALNTAAYQDWSDPDQQALFPGDRGLEFLGDLIYGQRINWPDFSDSG